MFAGERYNKSLQINRGVFHENAQRVSCVGDGSNYVKRLWRF